MIIMCKINMLKIFIENLYNALMPDFHISLSSSPSGRFLLR